MTQKKKERKYTLYDSRFEHDACGIGAVVNINGTQTHETVDDALSIVEKLEHRAGKDAAGETGDGVGILTQIPHSFFAKDAAARKISLGEAGDYGIAMLFFHSRGLKADQTKKLLEKRNGGFVLETSSDMSRGVGEKSSRLYAGNYAAYSSQTERRQKRNAV